MFWIDSILVSFGKFLVTANELNYFNPLSANPAKWSNTLKQLVGKSPANCLSAFEHFVVLAPKGLNKNYEIWKYEKAKR